MKNKNGKRCYAMVSRQFCEVGFQQLPWTMLVLRSVPNWRQDVTWLHDANHIQADHINITCNESVFKETTDFLLVD